MPRMSYFLFQLLAAVYYLAFSFICSNAYLPVRCLFHLTSWFIPCRTSICTNWLQCRCLV